MLVGDLHNYGDAGDMATTMQEHWMAGAAGNVQIVFNFDQAYPLAEMWVWNLNNYDPARGLRKVHIEYSTDGSSWTELTGFEINGIVPPPPDDDGNGISDACEQVEGCECFGDLNADGQIDLEDLQAVAGILLDAGSPFIAPCE